MNRSLTFILAIGLILTASSSWAGNQGERIEHRYDLRGDRIAQMLDAKGDRIQCQYYRLALHAALRGDFGLATALRGQGRADQRPAGPHGRTHRPAVGQAGKADQPQAGPVSCEASPLTSARKPFLKNTKQRESGHRTAPATPRSKP